MRPLPSLNSAVICCRRVGDLGRRSTMTSKIAPREQRMSLASAFGAACQCISPKVPLRRVKLMLHCATCGFSPLAPELFDAKHSRKIAADVLFTIEVDEESAGQFGFGE